MKVCSKCKEKKVKEEYQKNVKYRDGLASRCKSCAATASLESYHRRKDKLGEQGLKEHRRIIRARNAQTNRTYSKEYKARNSDKVKARDKAYRLANPEKVIHWRRSWMETNIVKVRKFCRDRVARKLQATPSWASEKYIELFYQHAKLEEERTNKKCHVDHIVPLKSKKVCGLHVEDNLQILFAKDNISKGNRTWPDMWE